MRKSIKLFLLTVKQYTLLLWKIAKNFLSTVRELNTSVLGTTDPCILQYCCEIPHQDNMSQNLAEKHASLH